MQDDPRSNQAVSTNGVDNPQPVAPTAPANKSGVASKKILMIVGGIVGLLLIVLIVLVIALLGKDDDSNGSNSSLSSEQTSSEQAETDGEREVLKRVPTSNDKLEYVIYKPVQNASNTTLYFAVENVCDGCEDRTGTYQAVSGFSSDDNSYLIDDNNGKKYSTITDQDDDVLATPSCGAHLEAGEKSECFVAFSKVPSGSTVSWVFGGTRIDNIKVE